VVFPSLGPTGSSVDRRFASPRFSVAPSEATTRGTGSWGTWSKPSAHPAVKCGSCPRGIRLTRISARATTPRSSALKGTPRQPSKNFPIASANSALSSRSSRRIEGDSEQSRPPLLQLCADSESSSEPDQCHHRPDPCRRPVSSIRLFQCASMRLKNACRQGFKTALRANGYRSKGTPVVSARARVFQGASPASVNNGANAQCQFWAADRELAGAKKTGAELAPGAKIDGNLLLACSNRS
jgi:hypothetical protein